MEYPCVLHLPHEFRSNLVHDLKYHARALSSARLRRSVEIAGGVENQIARGMVSVGSFPEFMDHFVGPAVGGGRQLEECAATARAGPLGVQFERQGRGYAFANVNPWPVLTFPRVFDAVREHLMSQQ